MTYLVKMIVSVHAERKTYMWILFLEYDGMQNATVEGPISILTLVTLDLIGEI